MFDVILLIIFVVIPAIVLHELAHGVVALWRGDDTAQRMHRLTLNPIAHIDPVGTLIVPGIFFLMHQFGMTQSLFLFGWAKPVPVNFGRLRNPRFDIMLVAVAGPVVNVILASLYILLFKSSLFPSFNHIFAWGFIFNLTLAVFNMIPIPPLDGSRILMGFLPGVLGYWYRQIEPFGFVIIVVMSQMGLLRFMYPIISHLAYLLGVQI